jgi:hypothetical protein
MDRSVGEIIKAILEANPGGKWRDAVKHLEATGRWDAVEQEIDRNFKARVVQSLEDEIIKALGYAATFGASQIYRARPNEAAGLLMRIKSRDRTRFGLFTIALK